MTIIVLMFALLFIVVTSAYIYAMEVMDVIAERKHLLLRTRCIDSDFEMDTECGTRTILCIKHDNNMARDDLIIRRILETLKGEYVQNMIARERIRLRRRRRDIKKTNTITQGLLKRVGMELLDFIMHTEVRLTLRHIRLKEVTLDV